MNYTGALTDNGLDFGVVPAGFTPNLDLFVQTSAAQQINLANTKGALLTFWDGGNSALFNNGRIDGGAGTWLATTGQSWADISGTLNGPWQADSFAIFQGTPGIVTVDNSAGAVTFSGAQFAVNGYTITGQPLTMQATLTTLRVGDGSDDAYRLREGVEMWLRGYYQSSEGDRVDLFRQGYESDGRSFILGADAALADSGVVGAYLAFDDLDMAYRGPTADTGRTRLDGWAAGVYGSYWGERRWFVQGALEYGVYDVETTRAVVFGPIAAQAQGDRDARAWTATAGAGYNLIPGDGWLIQPQMHLRYQRFDEDGYNERGAVALDLGYGDFDAGTFRGEAGVTVRRSLPAATAKPEISVVFAYANYVYDDALDDRDRTARFTIGDAFRISVDDGTRDGIRYGFGLEHTWNSNAAIQVLFEAEDYGEIENRSASLLVRKRF
nr:autotransporter outer membrane beta-barrel domain-containing protein [Lysobacter sp. MMG2]